MKYSQQEVEEALAKLRELLKPGDTVNTILRHVSRSGMSRSISLISADMQELDYWASRVLGDSIDQKHGGIRIGGCGMDMGFALVYNLSARLFPGGFGCIGNGGDELAGAVRGRGCPSNDHSNGDRDYTPHAAGEPSSSADRSFDLSGAVHWHRSGGYALKHRWL